ncbi:GNAT family N-acetyltransferase [Neotamlana laminarinivorans]|uniref:GNAT family N-acetyltransferase n=1 Tax=Neotamlana laminarinivorans TaxID=2883124 RepID=A0A9X1I0H9_9FLAO|nr:GNAT family N-acetyltransferase [Tamlana laminarinivorans]MCB4798966.1 GNAT family N-acetyltransferase [Tamlana laminarinivorans]
MLKIVRTHSGNPDFMALVKQLDHYLKIVDGDEHDFYNQYNTIDVLKHCIVAFLNDQPVGCGAFKQFDDNLVEIKRMFTSPEARGKNIASRILNDLEKWAEELHYKASILETGKRQIEAVGFYKKNNYKIIPNFGPYKNIVNSVCFKKDFEK